MTAEERSCCRLCGTPYSELDDDSGDLTEYGLCENCRHWFDTETGEPESPCKSCPVGGDVCRGCEDGQEYNELMARWSEDR